MSRENKIQELLIKHLLDKGYIKLLLPDGMKLELGIVQENAKGNFVKTDEYCWLIANHKERTVAMDSYNLGLKLFNDNDIILDEDDNCRHLSIV